MKPSFTKLSIAFLLFFDAEAIPHVEIQYSSRTIFGRGSTSSNTTSVQEAFGFSGETLPLLYPSDEALQLGCANSSLLLEESDFSPPEGDFGILFNRGICAFAEKFSTAEELGASLVIVSNQESSLINTTSNRLFDACTVDCGIANSQNKEKCESNSECSSDYCLPAFLKEDEDSSGFCCVVDNLIDMSSAVEFEALTTVFIEVKEGEDLASTLEASSSNSTGEFYQINIHISEREDFVVDPAVYILLLTATIVTGYAAYRSGRQERLHLGWIWGGKAKILNFQKLVIAYSRIFNPDKIERAGELAANEKSSESNSTSNDASADETSKPSEEVQPGISDKNSEIVAHQEREEERVESNATEIEIEEEKNKVLRDSSLENVELTLSQGMAMIVMASLSLMGMFFLVQEYPTQVVIALIVMFGLGAIYSTSYFFLRPIFRLLLPEKIAFIKLNRKEKYGFESFTFEGLLGILCSTALVVNWFIFRHEREKVWVLQNLFSFAVACMFLSTLRVSTLKTCVYVLFGFFIYDIFMVFITPSLFEGDSVMLVVATAGAGSTETVTNEDLHCSRTEDEQIPVLFLTPRFGYEGGFSLLGLGDVLLPGIFVSYVLRVDYIRVKLAAIMEAVKFVQENDVSKLTKEEIDAHFVKSFDIKMWFRSHFYFLWVVFAYFCGLAVTFVANMQGWTINGVPGQPALLYLVPFTIGAFCFLAKLKGELGTLWNSSLDDFSEIKSSHGPVRLYVITTSKELNFAMLRKTAFQQIIRSFRFDRLILR
eukprot:augustus_masked-scaffold_11-processed-gene-5.58-mRNA-1 protein AED:1.00 eAED:1.00 QI:0/0/0/0/1/1/2/0/769